MPDFCDVALPVPLDGALPTSCQRTPIPPVGGRVIVPFRNEKLIGIVTRLHDEPPPVVAKPIEASWTGAIVSPELLELAGWISAVLPGAAGRSAAHHAAADGRGAQAGAVPHYGTGRRRPVRRGRAGNIAPNTADRRRSRRPSTPC